MVVHVGDDVLFGKIAEIGRISWNFLALQNKQLTAPRRIPVVARVEIEDVRSQLGMSVDMGRNLVRGFADMPRVAYPEARRIQSFLNERAMRGPRSSSSINCCQFEERSCLRTTPASG